MIGKTYDYGVPLDTSVSGIVPPDVPVWPEHSVTKIWVFPRSAIVNCSCGARTTTTRAHEFESMRYKVIMNWKDHVYRENRRVRTGTDTFPGFPRQT